jgi:hypothetical protein
MEASARLAPDSGVWLPAGLENRSELGPRDSLRPGTDHREATLALPFVKTPVNRSPSALPQFGGLAMQRTRWFLGSLVIQSITVELMA